MTVLQAISTSLYAAKSRADINFAFVERVPIARQTRCARNCGHLVANATILTLVHFFSLHKHKLSEPICDY